MLLECLIASSVVKLFTSKTSEEGKKYWAEHDRQYKESLAKEKTDWSGLICWLSFGTAVMLGWLIYANS